MKIFRLILSLIFGAIVISCAPVQFKQMNDCSAFDGECVRINGLLEGSRTLSMNSGLIDILIVVDNSASMSIEQKKMGDRFGTFLASLDANKVDYRIAITTTDVSSANNPKRAINLNGALQDGNLIRFGNGEMFLTPSTQNKESLFLYAVARSKLDANDTDKETGVCENFLSSFKATGIGLVPNYDQFCPSQDERGIYASYLALTKNQLVRNESNKVAVIYLGDEDIRSGLYHSATLSDQRSFVLDALDTPQNLIQYFKGTYPRKALSLHSLVVNPGSLKAGKSAEQVADAIFASYSIPNSDQANAPEKFFNAGDSSCLSTQNAQGTSLNGVSASYGYLYALGSMLTGGVVGSICSSDFSRELGDIAKNIINNEFYLCEGVQVKSAKLLDRNGQPSVDVVYQLDGPKIIFSNDFSPGTKVQIQLSCPK